MAKSKLRHIALSVDDPFKTAQFFKEALDMEQVGETDSPLARGVYLSDGTICLAILNFKTGQWAGEQGKGIHHIGFWVDDIEKSGEAVVKAGGKHFAGRPSAKEGDVSRTHFEVKYYDPNGILFDLSATGWVGATRD